MTERRLLWLFVDALGWPYLNPHHFPKLLSEAREYTMLPFRPVLGYSSAIIPAILTGQPPGKTNLWNIFSFSMEESPFQWLSSVPLKDQIDNQPVLRYAINRIISILSGYETANVPLRTLPGLAVNPYLARGSSWGWFQAAGKSNFPTLIDVAEQEDLGVDFYGYPRHSSDYRALDSLLPNLPGRNLVICYLVGLDGAGHRFGPESMEMASYCRKLDMDIVRVLKRGERHGYDVVVSSDHGMTTVTEQIDLRPVLRDSPPETLHFFDSTMARFLCPSETELQRLRAALGEVPHGEVFDLDDLTEFGLEFTDRRFGDLFFLCQPGCVLNPNSFTITGSSAKGMHGYNPDTPTEKGIVLTTLGPLALSEFNFESLHALIAAFLTRK